MRLFSYMVIISNFNQEQYAATEDTRCIQVVIPDDDSYAALLAGLLNLPGMPENYLEPESEQAIGVADVWKTAYLQSNWDGCIEPTMAGLMTRADFWHQYATVESGNAIAVAQNSNNWFNYYARQNTAADGNQTSQLIRLAAGEYQYRLQWRRSTDCGKLNVAWYNLDENYQWDFISGFDMYGSTLDNQIKTGTFPVPSDGNYKLMHYINGKNTSSTGYFAMLTTYSIWRTGDYIP